MAKTAKQWNDAIASRRKALEKQWLKEARETNEIYEADDDDKVPFNILYSNTETLLPALYNSTPRPEVSRRYTVLEGQRPIDTAVASTGERILEYVADSNDGEYDTFDEATRDAVLGALVPGMGQVRIRYKVNENYQSICFERVAYDRFVWQYARKWKDVGWIAYGHDLNKPDFEKLFPEATKRLSYQKIDWKAKEDELNSHPEGAATDSETDGAKKEPTLLVWEVWEDATQKLFWLCEDIPEEFIKEENYPFKLTTKFPSPEPLKFIRRVTSLTPIPPYRLYQRQAEELNEISRRIIRVTKAIRARGAYNAQLEELEKIFGQDSDNALIPVTNAAAFLQDGQGFEKHIWTVPIDKYIQVLTQLYEARNSAKAAIYEIMGIGDILRGASQASETAKAQEIKNQWGTLRVKRMQKDVQVFCRDLFRISFEYASMLFTPATMKSITQLPYLFENEKGLLQKQITQFQMAAAQAQQGGMPPPQPPPNAQQLVYQVSLPSWETIIQILRNKFERTYRIDVETNSTIDLEATEDKAAIGEFMNAFGQMASGLVPMVESGALPFPAAKQIMMETFRRFRFGRRVEAALELMQQPQPKGQGDVEERHKAELAKVKADAASEVSRVNKQLLEMQETIVEATRDKAVKDIQIQSGKLEGSAQKSEVAAAKASLLLERNSMKQDMAKRSMELDRQKMEVDGKAAEDRLQLAQERLDQKLQQIEESKASPPPAENSGGGLEKALLQMATMQQQTAELFLKAIQVMSADRETELVRDEKTGKALKSVSRISKTIN